jgi:Ca2+-binding EF-hand superfamily protein
MVNTVYEPSSSKYNNKPCWVARSDRPVYLFHTRKARWVISKRLDDGQRCYAFVTDDGGPGSDDPTNCKGPWMSGGDDGQWKEDPNIRLAQTQASSDPFVKLRLTMEDEMRKYNLLDENSLKQLWKKLDKNGDHNADLIEVETMVDDLVKTGNWPRFMNNKTALERAFKKTLEDSEDGDNKIEKEEFHDLLLNIFWFTKLGEIFDDIDTSDDNLVDFKEFKKGLAQLNITMSEADAQKEFKSLDADGQGTADYSEFCLWVRRKVMPESNPNFDADSAHASKHAESMRKKGNDGTQACMVRKKQMADFDALEQKFKKLLKDNNQTELKKMWKNLDFNGNNVVSLAEIDKWVVEKYPLLNHKPALIRAQKATLEAGDGDDWVEKKEFKMLITYLFYYNKLFWLFDQCDADHDRRMDLKEFQWCLTMCGVKLSEAKAKTEFDKCNSEGGKLILFEEFCKYFVKKQCPDGLTEFIGDE